MKRLLALFATLLALCAAPAMAATPAPKAKTVPHRAVPALVATSAPEAKTVPTLPTMTTHDADSNASLGMEVTATATKVDVQLSDLHSTLPSSIDVATEVESIPIGNCGTMGFAGVSEYADPIPIAARHAVQANIWQDATGVMEVDETATYASCGSDDSGLKTLTERDNMADVEDAPLLNFSNPAAPLIGP